MRTTAVMTTILLLLVTLPLAKADSQPNKGSFKVCYTPGDGFFHQLEDGSFNGLEYDILAGFAEQHDLELETNWAKPPILLSVIAETGDCDVLSMTLTHTEEREELFDFSSHYFSVMVVLVEPLGQHSSKLDDLSGKRVATVKGSTSFQILSRNHEIQLVTAAPDKLYELVDSGKADALAWDSYAVVTNLQRYPDLRITAALSDTQFIAFALAKGSPLKPELDAYINSMLESGKLESLLAGYFGKENGELISSALARDRAP